MKLYLGGSSEPTESNILPEFMQYVPNFLSGSLEQRGLLVLNPDKESHNKMTELFNGIAYVEGRKPPSAWRLPEKLSYNSLISFKNGVTLKKVFYSDDGFNKVRGSLFDFIISLSDKEIPDFVVQRIRRDFGITHCQYQFRRLEI